MLLLKSNRPGKDTDIRVAADGDFLYAGMCHISPCTAENPHKTRGVLSFTRSEIWLMGAFWVITHCS